MSKMAEISFSEADAGVDFKLHRATISTRAKPNKVNRLSTSFVRIRVAVRYSRITLERILLWSGYSKSRRKAPWTQGVYQDYCW